MSSVSVKRSPLLLAVLTAIALLFSSLFAAQDVDAAVSKGEKVANYALTLKGAPFKYGGTTPKGFDASGFTKYVYAKSANVTLPRTSQEQYKKGVSVKTYQLKKGDLVFYKTNGKTVSFVGIYIGNKQFIGATSKGVRVQSMTLSYWSSKYVGAKRIVK